MLPSASTGSRRVDRSTVAIVGCSTYDPDRVYTALSRAIELLGGLDRFVRPGEGILLKPNILAGEIPERAATTHPAVLEACARLFREGGGVVSFGDSSGRDNSRYAADKAGLLEAGMRGGAAYAEFSIGRPMANPGGRFLRSTPIARPVHECDGLINLPKLKSHQLTRMTAAVKNLYGCVPGPLKALYHVQFQDVLDFSAMLVELAGMLRPRLHILDGIVAMEGNGPRSGDPKPMDVLVLSDDPVAVDATACRLVAMDPEIVPTTPAGAAAGLGRYHQDEMQYVGDPLEQFCHPEFKLIRRPVSSNTSYVHFNFLKERLVARPVIDPARCTRCGACVEACPVPDGALHFQDGRRDEPPQYDYRRCIRCYCCSEACPNRAIGTHAPLLGKLLGTA